MNCNEYVIIRPCRGFRTYLRLRTLVGCLDLLQLRIHILSPCIHLIEYDIKYNFLSRQGKVSKELDIFIFQYILYLKIWLKKYDSCLKKVKSADTSNFYVDKW